MDADTSNIVLWVALVLAVGSILFAAVKQQWYTVLAAASAACIAVVLLW